MSRQRISHGAEIETVTPDEMAAVLTRVLSPRPQEYRRFKGVIDLDAAGNGQSDPAMIDAPPQYDLLLERVTLGGSNSVGTVLLYENDTNSDTNLLEVMQIQVATGKYSDSFSNTIYVTAQSRIIIVVVGGTNGAQLTFNLQGRLIKTH